MSGFQETTATAAEVVAVARKRGATPHVVDGSAWTTKAAALDGIAAALSFPAWFGRNLDALADCLRDLDWLPSGEHLLVWSGHDALRSADPQAYQGIRSVLQDAVAAEPGPATLAVALTA